ncbi:hypothetical protein PAPYR_4063 [Paratrimastix pyriformis]|uniref:Uncharacterized protein n=1 Tax=Paratrimastix pyriformis TaxID=342808 RepID=A0ABQ8ULA2_9EUKA|nr:hypothetical protein PAPYR_4063 [Paratrimastix pyriformis]
MSRTYAARTMLGNWFESRYQEEMGVNVEGIFKDGEQKKELRLPEEALQVTRIARDVPCPTDIVIPKIVPPEWETTSRTFLNEKKLVAQIPPVAKMVQRNSIETALENTRSSRSPARPAPTRPPSAEPPRFETTSHSAHRAFETPVNLGLSFSKVDQAKKDYTTTQTLGEVVFGEDVSRGFEPRPPARHAGITASGDEQIKFGGINIWKHE